VYKLVVKGPVAMAASQITSSKQRGLTIHAIGQLSLIATNVHFAA